MSEICPECGGKSVVIGKLPESTIFRCVVCGRKFRVDNDAPGSMPTIEEPVKKARRKKRTKRKKKSD